MIIIIYFVALVYRRCANNNKNDNDNDIDN